MGNVVRECYEDGVGLKGSQPEWHQRIPAGDTLNWSSTPGVRVYTKINLQQMSMCAQGHTGH